MATKRWEHFSHDADIGVAGIGASKQEAFEQAAVALTAVITEPDAVEAGEAVEIFCTAPDDGLLLVDWLNALVYEMATRGMLFRRFEIRLRGRELEATAWGEPVDPKRHFPAVEVKGATYTDLSVKRQSDGTWRAQCVVDV